MHLILFWFVQKAVTDLEMGKKEIEKLREEVRANNEHMLQVLGFKLFAIFIMRIEKT